MAHDADAADDPDPSPGTSVHARTDRRPAGRSVETTPEALYTWQIAVLQARLDAEQSRAERAERHRQQVIDRYETLLDDRPPTGELYADGGRAATRGDENPSSDSTSERGRLDRLRSLF